jgi:hypothetical protein
MALLRSFYTNFTAGELSTKLLSRLDLRAYQNGAAQLRNYRQLIEGGVQRRPGTIFEYDLTTISTEENRLAEFIFTDDEAYIFVFSDTRVDIFDRAGDFVQAITSAVWTASRVRKMSIVQAGDFMWIAHKDFTIQEIERTAVDTFTLADYAFDADPAGEVLYQPYARFAAPSVTLDVSAYSGTGVTLTASASVFTANHDDTIIRYAGREILITSYTNGTTLVGDIKRTLPSAWDFTVTAGAEAGFSIGQVVTGEKSSVPQGTGIVTATASGSITVQGTGEDAIGFEGVDRLIGPSGDILSADITSVVDAGAPEAITDWDEQAFSPVHGYPRSIHLHDQRLLFGGSRDLPNRFWASKVGEFYNFDLGAQDDGDAIDKTIFDAQMVEIIGFASLRHLQIFTARQEFYVDTGTKGTLTPAPGQLSFRKQTRYGSAEVHPVEFDGATLFVTRSKNNIREFLFDDLQNAFRAESVSALANDLIVGPRDMGVMLEEDDVSEQYAFVINNDGTMAVFFSERGQSISGWGLWSTDGLFKSVQSCNGRVFVTVQRNIDGNDVTYLERFNLDRNLDASITDFDATPKSTWGPYAHLANETVSVNKGDLYLGDFTLDGSGNLDLGSDLTTTAVELGLNFTPTLQTLPPEFQLEDGITVGDPRRVVKVILDLVSSLSVEVNGTELLVRQTTDDLSIAPEPITERKEFYIQGWDNKGQITITQETPLALTLNGALVEVEI